MRGSSCLHSAGGKTVNHRKHKLILHQRSLRVYFSVCCYWLLIMFTSLNFYLFQIILNTLCYWSVETTKRLTSDGSDEVFCFNPLRSNNEPACRESSHFLRHPGRAGGVITDKTKQEMFVPLPSLFKDIPPPDLQVDKIKIKIKAADKQPSLHLVHLLSAWRVQNHWRSRNQITGRQDFSISGKNV